MKISSTLALLAILTQVAYPVSSALAAPAELRGVAVGAAKVKLAVQKTKEAALVLALSDEEAYKTMIASLQEQQVDADDILEFVNKYASPDERAVFNQSLAAHQNPETQAQVLAQIATSNLSRGANFRVSCAVGLGVGIPMMLAAIVVGILIAVNVNSTEKLQREYLAKRNDQNTKDVNQRGDLQKQIVDSNDLITNKEKQIADYDSKIHSGLYTTAEIDDFKVKMSGLQNDIVAEQSKIVKANIDLNTLEERHNVAISNLNDEEVVVIKQRDASKKALPYIAIPTAAIGAFMLTKVLKGGNC